MRIFHLLCGGPDLPGVRERVFKYVERFRREGVECVVKIAGDVAEGWSGALAHLATLAAEGWKADVVHNYRVPLSRKEIAVLRAASRRMIFEFDDAIYAEPPYPIAMPWKGAELERVMASTVADSDQVIAGNAELAEWARRHCPRVEILPTCLDMKLYQPILRPPQPGVVLGWVGMGQNLCYLEQIRGALEQVLARHPQARLRVLSDRPFAMKGAVEFRPWSESTQIREISRFDIGLMPLTDDVWSRGKCAYKAIQYLALSVPAVVSPVGMNREVVQEGVNGLTASTEAEWIEALSQLITDGSLRRKLVLQARPSVETRYSEDRAWEALRRIYGLPA
jgi:glycosyltransferase involved in cell wall biosynthesis